MKLKELLDGVNRILDAANEKFVDFCEKTGHDPDGEEFAETPEEEEVSDGMSGEGEGEGEGEGDAGAEGTGDENTMPTPDDMNAAAATEVPPEAQQMPVGDVNAGIPPAGVAPEGMPPEGVPPEGAPTPEQEEEIRKQQEQAAVAQ